MTRWQLVVRSWRYYWRAHLAVVLGMLVSTAVIAGALIVGDSVRYSLRKMTLDRLRQVDWACLSYRFFRQELATDLAVKNPSIHSAAALVLTGSAEARIAVDTATQQPSGAPPNGERSVRRLGRIEVYGLDRAGWELLSPGGLPRPESEQVLLNARAAEALNVRVGDEVTLWIELPSTIPRDLLLAKKENESIELTVMVSAIAPTESGPAQFGLFPNQQLPANAFVDREFLQRRLELSAVAPSRSDPAGRIGRVNTILASDQHPAAEKRKPLRLESAWQPADLSLRLVRDEVLGTFVLESEQMILETRVATAAEKAVDQLNVGLPASERWQASPVMIYLANRLWNPEYAAGHSMYSTVAGLDVVGLAAPFGPFPFVGEAPTSWGPNDVVVNEFLAEDLKLKVGSSLKLLYHQVGSHGELPEEERTFRVVGIAAMQGPAADRALTPTVRGITDVQRLGDWQQPFPMKLDEVTPRDDEYWNDYRATPKVFLPLATAQRLWPSKYGSLTGIRIAPPPGLSLDAAREKFLSALMLQVEPASAAGLEGRPIKEDGLRAASGSTDFTGLFVGFSLFLILSAMLLIGLLVRLNLERRLRELGLLGALGWQPRQVRRQLLVETGAVLLVGAVLGMGAAVAYAQLMLYGLKTWWIGAIGTKFLYLDVQPISLISGTAGSLITGLLAVWWAFRWSHRWSLRAALMGQPESIAAISAGTSRSRMITAGLSLGLAIAMLLVNLSGLMPTTEAFSGLSWPIVTFFASGMLMLIGLLSGLDVWLGRRTRSLIRGAGRVAVWQLAIRNAARQRSRSVGTATMIAVATFLIVAVAAGRKNPVREAPEFHSGNGGFRFVGEATTPILPDLNTEAGRVKVRLPKDEWQTKCYALRVKRGDDASCLNLFQARRPTILGVPDALIERGGFRFANTAGSNPWERLHDSSPDGSIPTLGDQVTLMFQLKLGLGSTIPIAEGDKSPRLRIAGMLDGSIFQGVLLVSEANFVRLFPEEVGYRYFLFESDCPPSQTGAFLTMYETALAPYGFDAELVAERLARFLAVQNTYLSTFQALGGLGLLLGTIGLAVVMLRNISERIGELALLQALGFRFGQVRFVVFAENFILLVSGLAGGTLAALVAMTPHLQSTGADAPWLALAGLLAAVLGIGCAATLAAIQSSVSSNLRRGLNQE